MIYSGLGPAVNLGLNLLRLNELFLGSKYYGINDVSPHTALEDSCGDVHVPLALSSCLHSFLSLSKWHNLFEPWKSQQWCLQPGRFGAARPVTGSLSVPPRAPDSWPASVMNTWLTDGLTDLAWAPQKFTAFSLFLLSSAFFLKLKVCV